MSLINRSRLDELPEEDCLLEVGGELQYLRLCLVLVIGSWYMAGFSTKLRSERQSTGWLRADLGLQEHHHQERPVCS